MHTEYEEFENIEDLFMYMSAAAPPMKNTLPNQILFVGKNVSLTNKVILCMRFFLMQC